MSHEQDDNNNQRDSEYNNQKEQILKQLLSSEARLRLNNVRMVKPDVASMVENYLIGIASQGKIQSQITDDQLKQILMSIQQPKRDFKFDRR